MKGEAPLSSSPSHGGSDGERLHEDGGRVHLLTSLRNIAISPSGRAQICTGTRSNLDAFRKGSTPDPKARPCHPQGP